MNPRLQTQWNELLGNVLPESSIFSEVDRYVEALVRTGSIDKDY
jgi:hypothetical protein